METILRKPAVHGNYTVSRRKYTLAFDIKKCF